MADQDGAALFWKWLLAVSVVIMLAIGGYALSLRFGSNQLQSDIVQQPNLALIGPQRAELQPPEGAEGSGEAKRHWDGQQFALMVQATLPDPGAGESYRVMLGKQAGDHLELSRVDGQLARQDDCQCYRLETTLLEESGYTSVILVIRAREGEAEAYDHVLKGQFMSEETDEQGE